MHQHCTPSIRPERQPLTTYTQQQQNISPQDKRSATAANQREKHIKNTGAPLSNLDGQVDRAHSKPDRIELHKDIRTRSLNYPLLRSYYTRTDHQGELLTDPASASKAEKTAEIWDLTIKRLKENQQDQNLEIEQGPNSTTMPRPDDASEPNLSRRSQSAR